MYGSFFVIRRLTKEHIQVCPKSFCLLQLLLLLSSRDELFIFIVPCYRPCVRLFPNQVKKSSKVLEELAKRFVANTFFKKLLIYHFDCSVPPCAVFMPSAEK